MISSGAALPGHPEHTRRFLLCCHRRGVQPVLESHGAEDCGDRDSDGFTKYGRGTDRGLINQGRKDSFDGVNDAAGRTADLRSHYAKSKSTTMRR